MSDNFWKWFWLLMLPASILLWIVVISLLAWLVMWVTP